MSKPAPVARRTLARQGPPPGIYASKYDPELAAAICRRIAAGESISAICADPAMPTGKTLWNWARAHPEFAAMKAAALADARARSLAERDLREAVRLSGPAAWNRGLDGYGWDFGGADDVLAWLALGETVAQACSRPGAPSRGTVYNWLKRYPAFLAAYRAAKAKGPDALVDRSCEHLQWEGARRSWVTLRRTLKAAERRARRLTLKRYAEPAESGGLRVAPVEADGTARVIYDAAVFPAHPGPRARPKADPRTGYGRDPDS